MMTARFHPVEDPAFRPSLLHIRRRMISCLVLIQVSSCGRRGRARGLRFNQPMRGRLELALPLVYQMALLPQSPLVLWKVTVLWSSLMMTARFRPVLALAFRHTRRRISRRAISYLSS